MHSSVLNQKGPFHRKTSRAALVLFLLILCQCARYNTTAQHPFLHGLDLKGFEQKGPMLVFNRQNIFEYMNGEADNYLPKGFNLLYVGKFFVQGKGSEMVMEVYDMGSQKGAASIFRVYVRPPGEALKGIGEGAWKSKSRCVFHRGPYFIRVTADPAPDPDFRPSPEDIEALAWEVNRVLGK
ncbi:MAG: hypothetical protein JRK53_24690 [Deltaproteobacteria bacterium]|nr:hypothetical protein [Deltaproteobacteria bacterium]